MRFDEVLLWGGNHYCKRLPDGGTWHAWDKRGGNGRGPNDVFADVEFAWTKARTKSRVFNYLWKGICQDGEKSARRVHPTQKPIALMEWCIGFTHPGATILDPYMGGGSTGIAAVRLGRPFIGMELQRDFFEAAVDRIPRFLRGAQGRRTLLLDAGRLLRPVQVDLQGMGRCARRGRLEDQRHVRAELHACHVSRQHARHPRADQTRRNLRVIDSSSEALHLNPKNILSYRAQ
jgi:hypothetical protein